jgi:hypothetical protein
VVVATKSAAMIHAPAVQVSNTSDAAAQAKSPETNRGPPRMVTVQRSSGRVQVSRLIDARSATRSHRQRVAMLQCEHGVFCVGTTLRGH